MTTTKTEAAASSITALGEWLGALAPRSFELDLEWREVQNTLAHNRHNPALKKACDSAFALAKGCRNQVDAAMHAIAAVRARTHKEATIQTMVAAWLVMNLMAIREDSQGEQRWLVPMMFSSILTVLEDVNGVEIDHYGAGELGLLTRYFENDGEARAIGGGS